MSPASSSGSATPSAELVRLTVAVAVDDAALAVATLAPRLGGCREREVAGTTLLDFWSAPGSVPDSARISDALADVGVACRIGAADDPVDWRAALRSFHRPVEVGPLRLRPPWEPTTPDLLDLVIDPGMAFGTGQHATTHGCLELLVDRPPGPVLDIGCGSGVLAIAAARLGHAPVRAIDNDPEAVAATAANAAANGVSVDVRLEVAGAEPLPAAALVLANLTLTDLVAVAPFLHATGAVIASGVRDHEVAVLADALAPRGLAASRTVARDGWAAVLFEACS